MQYLYCFANASLTLRIIDYVSKVVASRHHTLTVIYLVDRWVVQIDLQQALPPAQAADFNAVLDENGVPYQPTHLVGQALGGLEAGLTPTEVMNRYQVVVISHGAPSPEDLRCFRQRFVQGLGYCPINLV
ncbi:hypothetical protein IQ241_04440 [Romeria aff. gracilis LEGE 07310]|uniref:Uncharacterized protein n=1 Tax=Vasconcelosia minhoensis LEGE 07310 TaxID=915328 RepID=A0A8J7DQH0_9CYAN|nr:hypothetical protein [Romeria gracilis]MBE9076549.1 hypothetical protein [Romeria aff. gracilis LEGE 07310]